MSESETGLPADPAVIRRALALFVEPGAVVELRIFDTPRDGTVSGYFDDLDALVQAAVAWSGKAPGVYITMNRLDPALLARARNRVRFRAKQTTSDGDVRWRRWLLIDCDPRRLAGISATEAEHAAALILAQTVRRFLQEAGWPDPVEADSGNGGHLVYGIDLPNDAPSLALVKRCLDALDFRFSDAVVHVDLAPCNAARIWKLYGTVAAKGDATADRPHRRATLRHVPDTLEVVSRAQLEQLAALAPPLPPPPSRGESRGDFDIARWLADHADQLHVVAAGPWQGGRKWVLNPCPWDPAHTNRSAYIVELPSGALQAGCHHHGCAGKNWHALRDLVEPGWQARRRPERRDRRPTGEGRGTPGTPVLVRLADVPPEQIAWVWPRRIARGKVTLLVGDPGRGKSCVTLDVVARITTGGLWPADEGGADLGAVLLLTAEDGLADTLRPRLDVADGDAARVYVLRAVRRGEDDAAFSLGHDLPALEIAIQQTDAVLVVLDPLNAYFGVEQDSYKDTDVRSLLAPLAALAERTNVAVLAVMHLNKAESHAALYRVLGSIGFVAAARGALVVVADPSDPDRRFLGGIKSNLSRPSPALAFRIVASNPSDEDAPPRVEWEPTPAVGVDVEALMTAARDRDEPAARQDADTFLREFLAAGPVASRDIFRAGQANGLSRRTLFRAKRRLGIPAHRTGFGAEGGWTWELPAMPASAAKAVSKSTGHENVAPFDQSTTDTGKEDADFAEECHLSHVAPFETPFVPPKSATGTHVAPFEQPATIADKKDVDSTKECHIPVAGTLWAPGSDTLCPPGPTGPAVAPDDWDEV